MRGSLLHAVTESLCWQQQNRAGGLAPVPSKHRRSVVCNSTCGAWQQHMRCARQMLYNLCECLSFGLCLHVCRVCVYMYGCSCRCCAVLLLLTAMASTSVSACWSSRLMLVLLTSSSCARPAIRRSEMDSSCCCRPCTSPAAASSTAGVSLRRQCVGLHMMRFNMQTMQPNTDSSGVYFAVHILSLCAICLSLPNRQTTPTDVRSLN